MPEIYLFSDGDGLHAYVFYLTIFAVVALAILLYSSGTRGFLVLINRLRLGGGVGGNRGGEGRGKNSHQPALKCVYRYGVFEMKGRRPYMEDRHCVYGCEETNRPDVSVYAVFDGHGGAGAAQFCKDTLVHNVVNAVGFPDAPRQALSNAFLRTDQEYLDIASANRREDGTTAICLMVRGDRLTVANVGDSRAILVKRNGEVVPLSRDHKPNCADEQARISSRGGRVVHWGVWRVEGVLAVSRAIGDRLLKEYVIAEPEFKEIRRSAQDAFVIIASDGLWDVLSNEDVRYIDIYT